MPSTRKKLSPDEKRARQRAYHERHREKINAARRAAYNAKNRDAVNARKRTHYADNKDAKKVRAVRYRKDNPALEVTRLAVKRGARLPEGLSLMEAAKAVEPIYIAAQRLTAMTGIRHDAHHVIPCGDPDCWHVLSNLRVVSAADHTREHAQERRDALDPDAAEARAVERAWAEYHEDQDQDDLDLDHLTT